MVNIDLGRVEIGTETSDLATFYYNLSRKLALLLPEHQAQTVFNTSAATFRHNMRLRLGKEANR